MGPRGVRRASAAHSRTHSVWPSAGARFCGPAMRSTDRRFRRGGLLSRSVVRAGAVYITYLLTHESRTHKTQRSKVWRVEAKCPHKKTQGFTLKSMLGGFWLGRTHGRWAQTPGDRTGNLSWTEATFYNSGSPSGRLSPLASSHCWNNLNTE